MREYNCHVFLFYNTFHMENMVSASGQDRKLASKFRVAEKKERKELQQFREYQAENVQECINQGIPVEVLDIEDSPEMIAMASEFGIFNN